MHSLEEILDLSARRHGGREAVLAGAAVPRSADELAAIPDARWLEQMARVIFHAGISWRVVDARWPGIRDAFAGFAPAPIARMGDAAIDALLSDPRLIRSRAKIAAIRDNAGFVLRVSAASGGFGRRIADWPASDHAGLIVWLAREGARLGGTSGPNLLRFMGKDTWLLTSDVVARLRLERVLDGAPASPRGLRQVQAAFDVWQAQSGLSFNAISHILALSIDERAAKSGEHA